MTASTESYGIPQLDRLIAPIPSGASILILNDPGLGADPFLTQCTYDHLKSGRTVVRVLTTCNGQRAREKMTEEGFDVRPCPGALHFIDAHSPLMGFGAEPDDILADPSKPGHLVDAIRRAADAHPTAILVIDDLAPVLDHGDAKDRIGTLTDIVKAAKGFGLITAQLTLWPYSETPEQLAKPFNAAIRLGGVEGRVRFSQYFSVRSASWVKEPDMRPRLYKVAPVTGVLVYIPKLVVTGPHNAGKSTFVRAVSDTSRSADRMGTTVAIDHGHVTIDGLSVDVFGTPGQERFDPIIRTVANQSLGVLLLVDSTKPETFVRAEEMMQLTWKTGLPIIIAANKQDAPGAMSPAEVAARLDLPPYVQIVPCTSAERKSARNVLRTLLDQIMSPDEPPGPNAKPATAGGLT